jgi:hypothetical protein
VVRGEQGREPCIGRLACLVLPGPPALGGGGLQAEAEGAGHRPIMALSGQDRSGQPLLEAPRGRVVREGTGYCSRRPVTPGTHERQLSSGVHGWGGWRRLPTKVPAVSPPSATGGRPGDSRFWGNSRRHRFTEPSPTRGLPNPSARAGEVTAIVDDARSPRIPPGPDASSAQPRWTTGRGRHPISTSRIRATSDLGRSSRPE